MEQSIEVATEPLHAEIIEHRQMKGRQNQNTQKQVDSEQLKHTQHKHITKHTYKT